ncbi:MAG: EutN/CcmL family microcompartment protein [Synergistaceae bacterium]|jgi:ethanolamine utilization protein EutN/carbon dioxide concentrating mechanism protein CcmL|nr:EutN/CcmL family microcompartment protein [Synergistaceae bacterium]
MQLARVKGTVVSTNKTEKLNGLKLLIVKPIDIETFDEKGSLVVAIDTVGAGEGEVVMCVGGSSSRQTSITDGKPVDQSIIAIIDSVDISGERVFEKFKAEREEKIQ